MPYSNTWSSLTPIGSTTPAANIDEEIRKHRKDVEERMDHVIGSAAWSGAADPVINGTTVKSLTTLTTEMGTKAGINSGVGFIPIRSASTTFGNSPISVSGSTTTINSNVAVVGTLGVSGVVTLGGISYTWPASATNGYFLQYNAGVLSWVSVAASGAIGGSGTTGELAIFTASTTIGSTGITVSGSTISGVTINTIGNITCNLLTAATISVTALNASNIIQTGAGGSIVAQGYINSTSPYRVANTQVVGARIGGWGVPTGSTARTTFDTTTITLEELAERFAALVTDLRTHGLIGS